MYEVGDVVRKVDTYWRGALNESREDIGKLYVISEISDGDYGIRDYETGFYSAWWHDDQLEFVRHGEYDILQKLDIKEQKTEAMKRDLNYIKSNYPNISSISWERLFEEIGFKSAYLYNGEFFSLQMDVFRLSPIFNQIFINHDIETAISKIPLVFKEECQEKYKNNFMMLWKKLNDG